MTRLLRKDLIGFVIIGVAAFGAGRFSALAHVDPHAVAPSQAQSEKEGQEMPEEWAAWVEAGMPGPHHEHLNRLVGEWEGEFTMWMEPGGPPTKSTGSATREWIFGGRYLREEMKATSEMGEFEGISYLAYDNVDGIYKATWIDSMSTGIYMETGMLDPETMILSTRNSYRDPKTGKTIWTEGEIDMSDADRQVYKGYTTNSSGQRYLSFKGVLRRVSE
jgi:hypothetical protein